MPGGCLDGNSVRNAAWGNQQRYVDHITNEYNGQNRPAFTYNSA